MPRPNRLSVRWSRAREWGMTLGIQGDMLYEWGDGCGKADGHLLRYHFGVREVVLGEVKPSLIEELKARGYDLTTLKFSIRKLPGGGRTAEPTDHAPRVDSSRW